MRFVTNAPILKIFYFSINQSRKYSFSGERNEGENRYQIYSSYPPGHLAIKWTSQTSYRFLTFKKSAKKRPTEITSFNTFHNDLMLFWKSFVTTYIHLHALDDEMLLKEISNVHLKTYPICDLVIRFTVNPHPYF